VGGVNLAIVGTVEQGMSRSACTSGSQQYSGLSVFLRHLARYSSQRKRQDFMEVVWWLQCDGADQDQAKFSTD
jgi:hypothetical protein